MTQEELTDLLIRLMCCSSYMANDIATNLANGEGFCDLTNLIILNDIIDQLKRYDTTTDATNCLTEDEFDTMVTNAKNACIICDCE
jgi:hypothetical protein